MFGEKPENKDRILSDEVHVTMTPPPPSLICQIFTFAEPPLPSLSISLNMATSSLNGPLICSTVWFQIPHDIH